jgi:long-chain acyl-CoA synthetase
MKVEDFLEQSARQFSGKIALICGDQRLEYHDIEKRSNRLAHALISSGIKPGDRVAICLENSVEAVLSVFSVLKASGVFVVVNPTVKSDKMTNILNNSGAKILITHGLKLASIEKCLLQTPQLQNVIIVGNSIGKPRDDAREFIFLHHLLEQFVQYDQPPVKKNNENDLAGLIYTSGSTGVPKGVMMTHLNMVSAAASIAAYLENRADDVIMNVLPLSFDYGLYQIFMGFKAGATVVLERSFAYPPVVIERLVSEKVTGFPIVPTILAILFQMDLTKYDFSHLRYITNTGAFLPASFIVRLRENFPHVKIYSMYGLTECKRVAYLPPDQIDIRPGSVGKAMPNVEVVVVDDDGTPVAPGLVGELVVRGPNVMKGYWEMPEETEKVLKPGWIPGERVLYSGDLFRTDEEGYLYFVGRKDDVIKTRGEKVSPKEVENVLYGIKDVLEAAVVGVPDEILGQAVKAMIVPREGSQLTEKEVFYHCRQNLEDFMVPKYVEMTPFLPKTETGKILKPTVTRSRVENKIAQVFQKFPNRTAVVHKNRTWTYSALADLEFRFRARLKEGGFSRGDRVVLWMENSAEYIASYLAVLGLNGVVVALHSQVLPEEVKRVIRHVGAAGLITFSSTWKKTGDPFDSSDLRFVLTESELLKPDGHPPGMEVPDDLAQIIYTSGSTGQPKGVMLSHCNLVANADAIISYLGLTEQDSVMAILPFVYAYGNSVMLTHLLTGGKLVIENSFVYPNLVLDKMKSERVTGFSGVASTYAILTEHSNLKSYTFSSLRYLTHAGGPMPLDLLDRVRSAFDGKDLFVMYGQTEATARLTYLPPKELERKRGSAGIPIPGVKIKIIDSEGKAVPFEQTGEVAAAGENIMAGYWRNPDQSGKVLSHGWLRTGDLGRLDDEGFLYVIGRNSEIIKSGAFRISPYEIEEILLRHPEVFEAGVVGIDDPILGETIAGMVVPREGCHPKEQELLAFCARHLAPYKRPKAIFQAAELPKSPSGKILRQNIKRICLSFQSPFIKSDQ